MQTLEQSLADLTVSRVITKEVALGATSRPDQLKGLFERAGFESAPALRVAEATGR